MDGLDPSTQPASVREPTYVCACCRESFAAQTRGGRVAGSEAGHGEFFMLTRQLWPTLTMMSYTGLLSA
jgi:hypothetical protein